MNGIIRASWLWSLAILGALGSLVALASYARCQNGVQCSSGCATCGTCGAPGCAACNGNGKSCNLYDRCWPQRYNYVAEKEVNAGFTPQVQNGHILDQTIWTYFFEPGSDRLTPAGLDHLAYLVRRRPCPDTVVYVQTVNDLPFDPACPERYAAACQELDGRRVMAVQKFLVARTAPRPVDFQVVLHDPGDVTIATTGLGFALPQMYSRYRGGLLSAGGGGGGGGGAPAPGR
jgi:hypothetical protein